MFNPSRTKNGDYQTPKLEVINLTSPDIITISTPLTNGDIDENAWT